MYRRLDPVRLTETARRLSQRVAERFPESGLRGVADEVIIVCERAGRDLAWVNRPHRPLRIAIAGSIALLVVVFLITLVLVRQLPVDAKVTDMIQGIDAGVNEVVLLGAAIFFLSTLEVRRKRRHALRAIHELRSLSHIIDMHQLTKDPERIANPAAGNDTPSSPARQLTPFALSRYLDYCSEMLSLLSKSAALYVQDFDDPVTMSAVNDVEDLTSGLSRKIWQKIMIIDRDRADEGDA